jgi:hypothetical protein
MFDPSRQYLIPVVVVIFECWQVKWFLHHSVQRGQQLILLPNGNLCWLCGTSLEVWPLEKKADLVTTPRGPNWC